ncbi:hypothetical protein AQJ23_39260 [Streptomyces antibioticus]|nr:hypothetical protein [Streptomyces antibioticus]KUN18777.1 hypothetical protein AQJ23_39260 [Streptomyces antibioticus]
MNPRLAQAVRTSVVLGGLILTTLFGTVVADTTGAQVRHTAVLRADGAGDGAGRDHTNDTTDPWT